MQKTKSFISLFMAAILVLMTAVTVLADGGLTVSVKDGDRISGTKQVIFYSPSENGCTALLDGKALETEEIGSFELSCTATQVDYANSELVVGDKTIGVITKNGSHKFPLSADMLTGDEFAVTFLPSVGNNAVLDTSKAYGTYNIDDMSLSDMRIALPSGEYLSPSKVILRYPIVGKPGVTEKETNYSGGSIAVGDGWSASTGMGGSTPNQAISFVAVFDLKGSDLTQKAGKTLRATIDTSKYPDGEHTLSFTSDAGSVSAKVIFDNTAPEIVCDVKSGSLLGEQDVISITVTDDAEFTSKMKIDGKTYREGKPIGSYTDDGKTHTFTAVATDSCGNTSAISVEFRLRDGAVWNHFTASEGDSVTAEGDLYKVTPLKTAAEGNIFTVEVGDSKNLVLHYSGTTAENVNIRLYAKDNNGVFAPIADVASGDDVYIPIEVKPEYVRDGKITVKAEEYVHTSESNTMIWLSDTQYYTRFPDLLDKYKADLDYYADLYAAGKAGFLLHTGDVADEYSPENLINAQLKAGSDLHKVLDDAGIPYGIVNGNHDVGHALHDSSYFSKYFPASRFSDTSWFYGSLNNNESHYDLITLGGYDFVLVWLGYGVEAAPETLAWANDVLSRYSDRNAIILTHAYLDVDGDWLINEGNPDDYTNSRAKEIWEYIVVPNDNVVAVFCGHTAGASRNLRKVDDNRSVWEILADYQFFEDGTEPKHVLNGCTCDGEGFVRIVSFTGSEMTQKTYSPYSDKWNAFSADIDDFTVPLKLKPSNGRGLTASTLEVFAVGEKTQLDGSAAQINGEYLLAAADYTLSKSEESTPTSDIPSDTSTAEKDGGFPTVPVVCGVAAVIVIAAVAVVIIKSKKK